MSGNPAADLIEAVAQVHANVTRPIAVDPQVEEIDRQAAELFLAMLRAATEFCCAN